MITIKNLSKKYDMTDALKDVSLSIAKGEVFGLVGLNRAGKSTLINILSGNVKLDSGEISVNGLDVNKDAEKIKNIVSILNRGNSLEIASPLPATTQILILNELTAGVDTDGKALIFETIAKLRKEGITILYATSYMEEAERLCSHIAILHQGKILAQGTMDELRANTRSTQSINIHITNIKDERVENELLISKFIAEELSEMPGADFRFRNGYLEYLTKDVEPTLLRLKNRLVKFGFDISGVEVEPSNLESIFLSLTGKKFITHS